MTNENFEERMEELRKRSRKREYGDWLVASLEKFLFITAIKESMGEQQLKSALDTWIAHLKRTTAEAGDELYMERFDEGVLDRTTLMIEVGEEVYRQALEDFGLVDTEVAEEDELYGGE